MRIFYCPLHESFVGSPNDVVSQPLSRENRERFHSRGQHLCQSIAAKEIVKRLRKTEIKFSSLLRIFLLHQEKKVHQYGRRFIVLEHQD